MVKNINMKWLIIVILIIIVPSCKHSDCSDQLILVPFAKLTCTVAGAGNVLYNGNYVDRSVNTNGKRQYIQLGINDNPVIIFNATYGWSISHRLDTNDILYYSNMFGDNPPDLGVTQWQVLNGTPPGPTVSSV